MDKNYFKKLKLPDSPGVYFFIGEKEKILYIGKATSLRQRVRSYFSLNLPKSRSVLIEQMVQLAKEVKFQETDSVLEALILESNLIKKHKPKYNTEEKDDKSFNYLIITKEKFPRVEIVRKTEIKNKFTKKQIKYIFGPFPNGNLFREAIKIVRKIFPFRDSKCTPKGERGNEKGKPCFNQQIGLCFGACVGNSAKDYAKTIRNLKLFFEGKKSQLLKTLEKEMKNYAKDLEFEKADDFKKKIFALNHIRDVALIKRDLISEKSEDNFRIEAYDIAHLAGEYRVGAMVVVEGGEVKRADYRKFNIQEKENKGDGIALQEIIFRRLGHREWPLPDLIVVDGNIVQVNSAKKALKEKNISIPVVGVVKNEKHQPKDLVGAGKIFEKLEKNILLANFESHRFAISFHRRKRDQL